MLQALKDLLIQHGIEAPIEYNTSIPTRNGSQWLTVKRWEHEGREYIAAWFGDYKLGFKGDWKSWEKEEKLSSETIAYARQQLIQLAKEEKEEREKYALEIAPGLEKEWNEFDILGKSSYLTRKQLSSPHGARFKRNAPHDDIVIVPMYDVNGKFWNYQRIYAQKLSSGDKFFAEGARIDGTFFSVAQKLNGTDSSTVAPIYITEGYATAISVFEALGKDALVVAAFNANNLIHTATELRLKYPQAKIIVCADNDAYTIIKGKPTNVGIEKGRRAAGSVRGEIRYPIFKHPTKGFTDFNDLMCAEGAAIVADQITNFSKYVTGIQPLCLAVTKNGKLIPPSEKELCEYILKEFDGKLIRQDRAIFKYNGTHWRELDSGGTDRIKQLIGIAGNGLFGSRELESYWRYLTVHLPTVPNGQSMYQPNPFMANFRNGTLHCYKGPEGGYTLEFHKHDPKDYAISCLPFDYPESEEIPPAPEFEAMVERLWANNGDKEDIQRFARELMGACLMPLFPIITFFYGKPNSGKSTWIKLLVKLLSQENVSSVQPCDWNGFNMETMIGKLVNFDTDIDLHRPINDSEVKKIIDRVPRRIRRKGRMDSVAYLPAVHLFASNALPKSIDGSSHVYGRRFRVIETSSYEAGKERVFDYEQMLLDKELTGIVARAVKGLKELILANGLYTEPSSSTENVHKIEAQSDVVGHFLSDLEDGEITDKNLKMEVHPNARIARSNLWEVVKNWQNDALPKGLQIGKHAFFETLEKRGFKVVQIKGIKSFKGLGSVSQGDGIA